MSDHTEREELAKLIAEKSFHIDWDGPAWPCGVDRDDRDDMRRSADAILERYVTLETAQDTALQFQVDAQRWMKAFDKRQAEILTLQTENARLQATNQRLREMGTALTEIID